MSRRAVFLPEAQVDFDEAFDWCEQRRPGLGGESAGNGTWVLDRVSLAPDLYQEAIPGARRAVIRRFPYLVFYRLQPDHGVVMAVFHRQRDAQTWQLRGRRTAGSP